jgi:hypothetical protein
MRIGMGRTGWGVSCASRRRIRTSPASSRSARDCGRRSRSHKWRSPFRTVRGRGNPRHLSAPPLQRPPTGNAYGDRMLLGATPVRSPSHPHDWPVGLSTGGSERRPGPRHWDGSRTCTAVGSAAACSEPRERNFCVTDDLVATAIEAASGQKLWNTLRGLTVDLPSPGRCGR